MHNPPSSLVNHTQKLTDAIRQPSNKQSLEVNFGHYRVFVRTNIESVITCTFPFFCSEISEQKKGNLIELFLLRHHAIEPEFNHWLMHFCNTNLISIHN